MQAWDFWNEATSKIGQYSEEMDIKIEAFASMLSWGAGKSAKESMKMKKFESYLDQIFRNYGKTLKQVLAQVGTPSKSPWTGNCPKTRPAWPLRGDQRQGL